MTTHSDRPENYTDRRAQAALDFLTGPPMAFPIMPTNGEILRELLDAYDERLRVNVGLVAENAKLRREAESHRCGEAAA